MNVSLVREGILIARLVLRLLLYYFIIVNLWIKHDSIWLIGWPSRIISHHYVGFTSVNIGSNIVHSLASIVVIGIRNDWL